MKKRIISLLLALSMMISLVPVSALADTGGFGSAVYAADTLKELTICSSKPGTTSNFRPDTNDMEPDENGVYQGKGWRYVPMDSKRPDRDTLYLDGAFDFSDQVGIVCNVVIGRDATVKNASFNTYRKSDGDPTPVPSFTNYGTLESCEFGNCKVINHSMVQTSVFKDCVITNNGTITDSLFSSNSSISFKFQQSGNISDSVFNFDPEDCGLLLKVHSLKASDGGSISLIPTSYPSHFNHFNLSYSSTVFYTIGYPTLKVYYSVRSINGVPAASYDPDFRPANDSCIFTVQNDDVELSSSEKSASALEMNGDGKPNTGNMASFNSVYYGDGWTYDGTTLTLKKDEYDFTYTEPKNKNSALYNHTVDCSIVVEENAAITGGILAGSSLTNSGTVENILFTGTWITNNNGTLSCLLSSSAFCTGFECHTVTAVNGNSFTYRVNPVSSRTTSRLCFTGTPTLKVKLSSNEEITSINGDELYGGLNGPDEDDYYTFTPKAGEDVVLNRKPYDLSLVIRNGIPVMTGREPIYGAGNDVIGWKGDGWTYYKDSMTLTLESHEYNFSGLDQLDPDVELVVTGATLAGGVFNEIPKGFDHVQPISLSGSDSIVAVNGLSSPKWNTTLYAIKDSQVEIKADTDITNINGWDIGKFTASSYPNGNKKTVSFQMPDGPVVLNDPLYTLDIIRGKTTLGNTSVPAPAGTEFTLEADEPAENETFLGWTLSDESLLTDGKLNDPNCKTITIKMNDASATAEAMFQKDTPAYTLTVTGGGLVNGKTGAVVEAGKEVHLTTGEMQEGMSFNYWDLPTPLLKALTDEDSNFSNKVEPLTFTMPDLSKYTEDTRFTIRLDIRPAELPDDDDGPSVLGTMATVAVGGAAAGILVWQGVSLGVDSYLQLSLPDGVPVPTNRRELVVLLWETAGKPDVVLPALYGDVSAEDGELQKATRWAIDNGLVKPADESDASRFDPDRSVSKYEVARAWFKVQQMLK